MATGYKQEGLPFFVTRSFFPSFVRENFCNFVDC